MLEEIQEPYELVRIDLAGDRTADPDFARASPMLKVPALADGDVMMSESAAMGIYLSDRYAPGRLAPALDAPTRGAYLYWMVFVPGVMEPAFTEKVTGAATNRLSHGWGDYESMMQVLRQGMKPGPWLLGDSFSMADVIIGSSLLFLRQLGVLPDTEADLYAYADRCGERAGYHKAMELER